MPGLEPTTRQEYQFALTTNERGKFEVKMVDRITVDDVFTHLVGRELYSLVTGRDIAFDVSDNFKAFLIKERFTTR
jgi:hypothetical protein